MIHHDHKYYIYILEDLMSKVLMSEHSFIFVIQNAFHQAQLNHRVLGHQSLDAVGL